LPIAQIPCTVIALILRQAEIDTACDVAGILVTCPYASLLLTSTLSRRRGRGAKVDLGLPVNVGREGAGMTIEAWLFHFESKFGDTITVGFLSSLFAIRVACARGTRQIVEYGGLNAAVDGHGLLNMWRSLRRKSFDQEMHCPPATSAAGIVVEWIGRYGCVWLLGVDRR